MLSIVVPTLNAAQTLSQTLAALAPARADGLIAEVLIIDGGSEDATPALAVEAGASVMHSPKGRGRQLALGAERARAPWLFFLHADTVLDPGWAKEARAFIDKDANTLRAAAFQFAFDDDDPQAQRIVWWVRQRCRFLKLPYGDQGLLISRGFYDHVGGFRPIALMEDVDMVRRIGARRMIMLNSKAVTSAAKYRRDGYQKRAWRNLALLARFYMGADPNKLARFYD